MKRNRIVYLLLFVLSIALGLLSRVYNEKLSDFLALYLGDAIWGFMVYWLMSVLVSPISYFKKWLISLFFCFSIEFSQLYKGDWIEHLREYKLVALVIGYDFIVSDLICYTVGFTLALLFDYFLLLKDKKVL